MKTTSKSTKKATRRSQQRRVEPRWIAWVQRASSNGRVTRWTRWHLVTEIAAQGGNSTLCGLTVPHTKIETCKPSYHIKGGECAECQRLNTQPVPQ